MDIESTHSAALASMQEQRDQALDQRAELQRAADALGTDLADTRRRLADLKIEVETLRRIRHLALSYREAVMECTWSFAEEPRIRRYRRAVELDTLLGIEPPEWRGKM